MLRVRDPKPAVEFFEKLGLRVIDVKKFPEWTFDLYFMVRGDQLLARCVSPFDAPAPLNRPGVPIRLRCRAGVPARRRGRAHAWYTRGQQVPVDIPWLHAGADPQLRHRDQACDRESVRVPLGCRCTHQ